MRTVLNINQDWTFVKGMHEVPAGLPETCERVSLPHTWNAKDGQDGGNDYFRGTCCYARQLKRSALPAGDRLYLEINGANSSADVYLNGTHLAHHDGGYSIWRVDITDALREENTLAILVDNAAKHRSKWRSKSGNPFPGCASRTGSKGC